MITSSRNVYLAQMSMVMFSSLLVYLSIDNITEQTDERILLHLQIHISSLWWDKNSPGGYDT